VLDSHTLQVGERRCPQYILDPPRECVGFQNLWTLA
jgi:hypothetical protein